MSGDERLREAIAAWIDGPGREHDEHTWRGVDDLLALPEIAELRAKAAAADRARAALEDLTEAVGRGDEVGLPEAYRAAVSLLRTDT